MEDYNPNFDFDSFRRERIQYMKMHYPKEYKRLTNYTKEECIKLGHVWVGPYHRDGKRVEGYCRRK